MTELEDTNVAVPAARLAHLEAIERAAEDWCQNEARSQEFLRSTARALYQVIRDGHRAPSERQSEALLTGGETSLDEIESLRKVKAKVYDLLADLDGVTASQKLPAAEVVRALLIILDEEA